MHQVSSFVPGLSTTGIIKPNKGLSQTSEKDTLRAPLNLSGDGNISTRYTFVDSAVILFIPIPGQELIRTQLKNKHGNLISFRFETLNLQQEQSNSDDLLCNCGILP